MRSSVGEACQSSLRCVIPQLGRSSFFGGIVAFGRWQSAAD